VLGTQLEPIVVFRGEAHVGDNGFEIFNLSAQEVKIFHTMSNQ
jgi:hypothetical protein